MRKLIICIAVGIIEIANPARAAAPGPYLGLQLGWGDLNQGTFIARAINKTIQNTFPKASVDSLHILFTDTGRGGRAFIGYQFNRFFAMELGYSRFSTLNFNAKMSTVIKNVDIYSINLPLDVASNVRVNTDAFDLVAKGMLPLTDKFNFYAKLGVVSLNSFGSANLTFTTPIANISFAATPSINLIYPVFGLGMNYDITQHASVDLSVTRIQKVNPCLYPSIDFGAAGLIYHFY